MNDARLCDLRPLGRSQRTRGLRRFTWLLDAKPDRWWNKASCRLRGWRHRRCGDGCGRLFDCLLDNRWFFDWDGFGNDHDRRCFIDDNRRRWLDFNDGWWCDDGDGRFDRFVIDDRWRC